MLMIYTAYYMVPGDQMGARFDQVMWVNWQVTNLIFCGGGRLPKAIEHETIFNYHGAPQASIGENTVLIHIIYEAT